MKVNPIYCNHHTKLLKSKTYCNQKDNVTKYHLNFRGSYYQSSESIWPEVTILGGFAAALLCTGYLTFIKPDKDAKKVAVQYKEILDNSIKTNFQNPNKDEDKMKDAIEFAESYLPLPSEILANPNYSNQRFQKLNNLIKTVTSPSSEGGNSIILEEKKFIEETFGKKEMKVNRNYQ